MPARYGNFIGAILDPYRWVSLAILLVLGFLAEPVLNSSMCGPPIGPTLADRYNADPSAENLRKFEQFYWNRRSLARGGATIRPDAATLPMFLDALENPNKEDRTRSARAIGRDAAHHPALVQWAIRFVRENSADEELDGNDFFTREAMAEYLVRHADGEEFDLALEHLSMHSTVVRQMNAEDLRKLGQRLERSLEGQKGHKGHEAMKREISSVKYERFVRRAFVLGASVTALVIGVWVISATANFLRGRVARIRAESTGVNWDF